MNDLVKGMSKESNKTTTQNGRRIKKSSQNALVDLFFAIGALRADPDRGVALFQKAVKADLDLAVRIALYARDVRGGMGEREVFRRILKDFAQRHYDDAKKVIPLVPEVGRWDDLFALMNTPVQKEAFDLIEQALVHEQNGLAAKWMPREKGTKSDWAKALRKHMGLKPKEYRKLLVSLSSTVEQQMSAHQWGDINFEHVPSVASARYQNAFSAKAPHYQEYIASLEKGDAKINAEAIFPHTVIQTVLKGEKRVAEQQWKALPDYLSSGKSFVPVVDVSGSMSIGINGGYRPGGVRAMDVSIALGLYCAQRNKSAFQDKFITFSDRPEWIDVSGLSLAKAVERTARAPWGMNTNLDKTFELILDVAKKNNVPQGDMPDMVLILSDMQFDQSTRGKNKVHASIKEQFKEAGYKMPDIVYWNLVDYGSNTPVSFDKNGTALISGFSPSIMKSVMAADTLTPFQMMLDAVGVSRYEWNK